MGPAICAAVTLICRYNSEPTEIRWKIAKRILSYLRTTSSYALRLYHRKPEVLVVFHDSDWVGDRAERRSTTEEVLKFGRTPLAWKSVKQ